MVWDRTYDETFRQFLITSDGQEVVFLGKNYYYAIYDKSDAFKELLTSPTRGFLFINTEKTQLKIDREDNLSGYVTIESFFNKLPFEDDKFLRALGFRINRESSALSLAINLSGKRYLPRNNMGRYLPILDRTYIIPIHYKTGIAGDVGKVVATPFAIMIDGLILIKNIIILPFRGN